MGDASITVMLSFSTSFGVRNEVVSLAVWSSGMILASGARGPGFNSQNSPSEIEEILFREVLMRNKIFFFRYRGTYF